MMMRSKRGLRDLKRPPARPESRVHGALAPRLFSVPLITSVANPTRSHAPCSPRPPVSFMRVCARL